MASTIAVLDARVLIPVALRDTLLRATERKLFQARWTNEILEEVRRNLITDLHLEPDKAQRLVDHIRTNLPQNLTLEDYHPSSPRCAMIPKIAMSSLRRWRQEHNIS